MTSATASRLAQKIAVVTGGAAGIGAAIVRRFVADGARVLIADRDSSRGAALCAELGDATRFFPMDVSDADSFRAAIALAGLSVPHALAQTPPATHQRLHALALLGEPKYPAGLARLSVNSFTQLPRPPASTKAIAWDDSRAFGLGFIVSSLMRRLTPRDYPCFR